MRALRLDHTAPRADDDLVGPDTLHVLCVVLFWLAAFVVPWGLA